MKVSYKMPLAGHFSAVWEHNGKTFANSYKWGDNFILTYDTFTDEWRDEELNLKAFFKQDKNFSFYTL